MDTHSQRVTGIIECLQREQQVSIRQLAAQFAVSTMTVRRDLEKLEAQGVLVRTFGGAMALSPSPRTPVVLPSQPQISKQAIGRVAASLVTDGQTIIVDAGTTCLEVVRHLPRHDDITLVTNSLAAVQTLAGSGMRVLMLGGYLSDDAIRLYGPMTEGCLAQLHAEYLFVGCVGANSTHGFYMSDLYLTSNVKAMMQAADQVVVVAESLKFRQRSLSCFALPSEVQFVVTDSGLEEEDRAALEAQGVSILIAELMETGSASAMPGSQLE